MSKIMSVNVGEARTVEFRGRPVSTGIYKFPVEGQVRVEGVNLAGDDQVDRRVHGGVHKAVYAYASEDYEWWGDQLGRALSPGMFGDNLTTEGIDVGGAVVGQHWTIGDVVLEVSEPRVPCYKLGIRMEDPEFPEAFSAAARPGSYLRIAAEGSLAAGDHIEIGTPPTTVSPSPRSPASTTATTTRRIGSSKPPCSRIPGNAGLEGSRRAEWPEADESSNYPTRPTCSIPGRQSESDR